MHYQNAQSYHIDHHQSNQNDQKHKVTIFWPDNLLESAENQKELSICGELLSEKISIFGLSYLRPSQNTHTSLVFSAMLWACSHICHGWNLYAKWDNMTCIGYIPSLGIFHGKNGKVYSTFLVTFVLFGRPKLFRSNAKKRGKNKMIPEKNCPLSCFYLAPFPMWFTDCFLGCLDAATDWKGAIQKVDDTRFSFSLENFPFFVGSIDVKKKLCAR